MELDVLKCVSVCVSCPFSCTILTGICSPVSLFFLLQHFSNIIIVTYCSLWHAMTAVSCKNVAIVVGAVVVVVVVAVVVVVSMPWRWRHRHSSCSATRWDPGALRGVAQHTSGHLDLKRSSIKYGKRLHAFQFLHVYAYTFCMCI